MTLQPHRSRQPLREPWTTERFYQERALACDHALDSSTRSTYSSHLNSYLAFCDAHAFPYTPTADILSFYVVYMSYHIEPRSITSYLSGICSSLESYYPGVRKLRNDPLVVRTLRGCMRMRSKPVQRKRALECTDLQRAITTYPPRSYDDHLFMALLFTGFHCLLRLGDMVQPDKPELRTLRKITRRASLTLDDEPVTFTLPTHKSDRAFEGDHVVLTNLINAGPDPVAIFRTGSTSTATGGVEARTGTSIVGSEAEYAPVRVFIEKTLSQYRLHQLSRDEAVSAFSKYFHPVAEKLGTPVENANSAV
ncbi:uncharacterized protein BXZ73DRAFT_111570 [Epithele typhae]|uniref:uncharacterized protein n=1 Tax=Epithele typhae TaxID=378194 RepID=UPI002008CF03|nr:uncharacterized protein BXZ73DRAFT_111570 [Epithele typhae]KAH9900656.1 hypothetical protein BXZ73DRAFT_111570 [Epithele typhae]